MRRVALIAILLMSPVLASAEEAAQGSALVGDGTLYRSGLVERRAVGEAPAFREELFDKEMPAVQLTPVSFSETTLSRFEVPQFGPRVLIWVMMAFAAMLGLVLSTRHN